YPFGTKRRATPTAELRLSATPCRYTISPRRGSRVRKNQPLSKSPSLRKLTSWCGRSAATTNEWRVGWRRALAPHSGGRHAAASALVRRTTEHWTRTLHLSTELFPVRVPV